MKFTLTQDQRSLGEVLREFLADRAPVTATLRLLDGNIDADGAVWAALAGDLGVVGVDVAEDDGGVGLGAVELAVVAEQLGTVAYAGPFLATAGLAVGALRAASPHSHAAQQVLIRAMAGSAMTLVLPQDGVRLEPGTSTLSGTARRVLQAATAETILVLAADGDSFVLLAVDRVTVRVAELAVIDPSRPMHDVTFDSTAAELLARLDPDTVEQILARARLTLAAEAVGGARACLESAAEHARIRQQFGRAIGSYQGVKHRLADGLVDVELAVSAVYAAAAHLASNDIAAARVSVPTAMVMATETYARVAGDLVQVHGGIGFTWEHHAQVHVRRAQADRLFLGGAPQQLATVYACAGTVLS